MTVLLKSFQRIGTLPETDGGTGGGDRPCAALPEADLAALDGEVGEVEGFGSLAGAPTTLNDAVVAPVLGSSAYRGKVVR